MRFDEYSRIANRIHPDVIGIWLCRDVQLNVSTGEHVRFCSCDTCVANLIIFLFFFMQLARHSQPRRTRV